MSYLTNPYRYAEVSQHYSTDFSSHGDWSANTDQLNIVNNRLEWDCDVAQDQYMNLDLSALNVSDTEWCLRYEFEFATLNANTNDVNNACIIGLFSTETPSGLISSGDSLRYSTYTNNGFANILDSVAGGSASCSKTDVSNDPFSLTTNQGTNFYVETKRVSAILLEQRVWTGSFSGTPVGTAMSQGCAGMSTVNDTQFLTIHLFCTAVEGGGYSGYINQLDFYNNSSVPF